MKYFCLVQEHQEADEINTNKSSAPKEDTSFPQPPPFPSINNTTCPQTPAPHGIQPNSSQPRGTPFPLPIPPFPPASPHLLNFIPPPGWIPPPGHCIPYPPPSHPTPPTFLRPPPPLMVPPRVPPPLFRFPGSSLPFPMPPWPSASKFNPFVPPPNFQILKDNLHKVTIEKVSQVIIDELKVIIKKDITRRMIEGTAFKMFEEWWKCQDMKSKVNQ